ncbi:MAG: PQQ-binding-like beta-propeller repeat protein [Phycisphaerales bacterium]|nr:PQQ-binding-like beta-propeller repeat protein [Phycisphaerales bacterium]
MRTLSLLLAFAASVSAQADWTNLGGNAARNGLTASVGPVAPELAWGTGPSSIIAWHPCITGDRVYLVRQLSFVPSGVPNDAEVYCLDLADGSVVWSATVPYESGDWTPVLYGVANGRVFSGRGGNGNSVSAPVHCYDAATGTEQWVSDEEVATGSYDGVVFADDGDPVFATNQYVRRIDAATGATVWNTPRNCSVSGDCGPCIANGAVYVDEVAPGGQVVTRFDLESGERLYSSPIMPGFLSQNTPLAGPDGSLYYPRTQGNELTDFFYAFTDTGTELIQRWFVPCVAGAGSQHATAADGSVYILSPAATLQRLDAETGAVIGESAMAVAGAGAQSHFAIGGDGTVYYGNGGFPGTVFAFTADLELNWSVVVPNLNQGGPSLGPDGTLVVCGNGTVVRAYRTTPACAAADLNCDGVVDGADLGALLGAWGGRGPADLNGDGVVDGADLGEMLAAWG